MMNRRTFVRGTLLAVGAATGAALVKLASPADVQALTLQKPVLLSEGVESYNRPTMGGHRFGTGEVYMQDETGTFRPIGFITQLNYSVPVSELPSWDGRIIATRGLPEMEFLFKGWAGYDL